MLCQFVFHELDHSAPRHCIPVLVFQTFSFGTMILLKWIFSIMKHIPMSFDIVTLSDEMQDYDLLEVFYLFYLFSFGTLKKFVTSI